MATITAKRLITPAQLTASVATYYTVPDNTRTTIKKITVTNSTTTPRTVTVYLVPKSGTAGVTNIITSTRTINANTALDLFECMGHTLEAGSTIQSLCDAATAVTIHGSGIEVV